METRTRFVFLMHPKEFKKEKAATGRLTHLCLANSEIFMGIAFDAHEQVQALLHDWGRLNTAPLTPDGRLLDQFKIGWFREMNRALDDPLDDAAFAERIRANVARMRLLAAEILMRARVQHPRIDDHGLDAMLDGTRLDVPQLAACWYASAA